MSVKMWRRSDEFVQHAPCGGDPRFTTAPWWDGGADRTKLEVEDVEYVEATCAGCPVRVECIKDAMFGGAKPSHSVWVAGEWLPDPVNAAARRQLEDLRVTLITSLDREASSRPSEFL